MKNGEERMALLNSKNLDDRFKSELHTIISDIPSEFLSYFYQRDVAYQISASFSKLIGNYEYSIEKLIDIMQKISVFFINTGRIHEAITILDKVYHDLVCYEVKKNISYHKGAILLRISQCYNIFRFPVLSKRYLMLTLIEDSIRDKGEINVEEGGVYFRLVWEYGLSHDEVINYAEEAYRISNSFESSVIFPERILNELSNSWMIEIPSAEELMIYKVNKNYITFLTDNLGEGDGKKLEELAEYLLVSMPGCHTQKRSRTYSTDYDVLCTMNGLNVDFRSELGRYFVCECKDWNKPVDFSSFAKFCRVLDSIKTKFGIIFSTSGLSGEQNTTNSRREQLKVYQDRGMIIVVMSLDDILSIAKGRNMIKLIQEKYEKIRLDIF